MDGHVAKPIERDDLLGKLEAFLSDPQPAPAQTAVENSPPEASVEAGEEHARSFDRGAALACVGGDEELLQVVLDVFLGDTPKQIDRIEEALAAGDARLATRAAHTIGGASGNVGAHVLRDMAAEAERAARDGDTNAAEVGVSDLRAELERVRAAVKAAVALGSETG